MHLRKRNNLARSEGGFTLIELLVGMTVTLLGMAGLVAMHTSMARGTQSARDLAEASTIVDETVEQVRAFTGQQLLDLKGQNGDGYIDTVIGKNGMSYARFWQVTQNNNLIKVRVEVAWNDSGNVDPQGTFDHLTAFEYLKDIYSGG